MHSHDVEGQFVPARHQDMEGLAHPRGHQAVMPPGAFLSTLNGEGSSRLPSMRELMARCDAFEIRRDGSTGELEGEPNNGDQNVMGTESSTSNNNNLTVQGRTVSGRKSPGNQLSGRKAALVEEGKDMSEKGFGGMSTAAAAGAKNKDLAKSSSHWNDELDGSGPEDSIETHHLT
ncbi:hypothetical protein HDU76_002221, partial [Blyttiomyces sp. JEL0837]